MASIIEVLMDVIEEEIQAHEALLETAVKKTSIIIKGNLTELSQITEIEQIQVEQLSSLERKREESMYDICMVLGKKPGTVKFPELIELMESQPEVKGRLQEEYKRLKNIVYELKDRNEHNRSLINDSLEMAEFSINLLQNTQIVPDTANYNKGAYNVEPSGTDRALFDTKS